MEPAVRAKLLDDTIRAIPDCRALFERVVYIEDIVRESKYKLSQRYPDLFATRSTVTVGIDQGGNRNIFSEGQSHFA